MLSAPYTVHLLSPVSARNVLSRPVRVSVPPDVSLLILLQAAGSENPQTLSSVAAPLSQLSIQSENNKEKNQADNSTTKKDTLQHHKKDSKLSSER